MQCKCNAEETHSGRRRDQQRKRKFNTPKSSRSTRGSITVPVSGNGKLIISLELNSAIGLCLLDVIV